MRIVKSGAGRRPNVGVMRIVSSPGIAGVMEPAPFRYQTCTVLEEMTSYTLNVSQPGLFSVYTPIG